MHISNFSPYSVYATVKSKSHSNWNYDVSINFANDSTKLENFHSTCSCKDIFNITPNQKRKICWHVVICLLQSIDESNVDSTTCNENNDRITSIDEFEVERVLASKQIENKTVFLVKWRGYPVEQATWEDAQNLSNAAGCIEYLESILHNSRIGYVNRREAN